MQCVLIVYCFICNVSLLCTALYAKCPYYVLLHMQCVLIMYCFMWCLPLWLQLWHDHD
jgi:hypothetical protein